jgi:outer membrane protein TolC
MPAPLLALVSIISAAFAIDEPAALVAEAMDANRDLATMALRVTELDALAHAADVWPDPMVGLEYSNVPVTTWALADHPMAGLQLRIQQTLPYPGVTELRRDVATSRVQVASASLAETRVRLAGMIEGTWWRLVLTRQLRAVTEDHVALTDKLVASARARYETGSAGQHELVRLQVLREKLQDDLSDFDRQDRQLTAALTAALHRSTGTQFETPTTLVVLPVAGDLATWLTQARTARPALEEQRAIAQSAELASRLARRDARPDLTVWGGYRLRTAETEMDPGTDLVAIGASLPLTFNAARAGKAQAAAALYAARGARERHDALLDTLAADLESSRAAWERAVEKAQVYERVLIPGAQAALDTTLADYRVNRADFASLYQTDTTGAP